MTTSLHETEYRPLTMRFADAAERLGVSEYQLRNLVRDRRIRSIRVGRFIVFRDHDLQRFLDEQADDSIRQIPGIRRVD